MARKPECLYEYMNVDGGGGMRGAVMGLVRNEDEAIVTTGAKFSYLVFIFFKVLG